MRISHFHHNHNLFNSLLGYDKAMIVNESYNTALLGFKNVNKRIDRAMCPISDFLCDVCG